MAAPQGSKKYYGPGRVVESSKKVEPYRAIVRLVASKAMTAVSGGAVRDCPVSVLLAFAFPRPKKHFRANGEIRADAPFFVTTTPDVDKLIRSTLDGLTGVVFLDDKQVVRVHARKHYTDGAGYVNVSVSTIEHPVLEDTLA